MSSAIVFGCTPDHVFAVGCVLFDLKRTVLNHDFEVILFSHQINEGDLRRLQKILPVKYVNYKCPINPSILKEAPVIARFTEMVFSKFECLKLLEDYDNVIWLDYDIIVQGNLDELFESSISGIKMLPGGSKVSNQLLSPVNEYDMEREGICGSTFVLQKNMRRHREAYEFCYVEAERFCHNLYLGEQAIFDFMIQYFKLEPVWLSPSRYTPHPNELALKPDAQIFHAYGQPKFWNGLHNTHWQANYEAWNRLS